MRNSEKDRAKRKDRKQRLDIKAKKMACWHTRRTIKATGVSNTVEGCYLYCLDCGATIHMVGAGVFGTGLDPQAKKK